MVYNHPNGAACKKWKIFKAPNAQAAYLTELFPLADVRRRIRTLFGFRRGALR